MDDLCTDNRFELIEKYKHKLTESTNIESAPDETAVLDNILFRFWQMGWLDKLDLPSAQPKIIRCKDCKHRDPDGFCTGRGYPNMLVVDDGFCDKGERIYTPPKEEEK